MAKNQGDPIAEAKERAWQATVMPSLLLLEKMAKDLGMAFKWEMVVGNEVFYYEHNGKLYPEMTIERTGRRENNA